MPEEKDVIVAQGVGMKQSEWNEMRDIAEENGITLNGLSAHALRQFIKGYRAGLFKIETIQKNIVKE